MLLYGLQAISKYLSTGGNPAFTIMQFNPIREKFMADLEAQVSAGKFDEVFVDRARERWVPCLLWV